MKGFYPEGKMQQNISKANAYTVEQLEEAIRKRSVLEAVAYMCDSEHNLLVNLGCMKGVIPRKEGALGIAEGQVRDIAIISRVGKSVCFVVEKIKEDSFGKPYAVLSRRKAQEICNEQYISSLATGDVIPARITHTESFGAFCDIGCGVVALLPIDSISVSRISHPRDRFTIGQDIRVAIKQILPDGKIMLTMKELLGTWAQNAQRLSAGQTVTGIVRSIESYGIFVELSPNLAGLAEPKDDVYVGQQVSVYIKSIIYEKMKVKLIIIDSFDNAPNTEIEYFYNDNKINEWVYSPENSAKEIITKF